MCGRSTGGEFAGGGGPCTRPLDLSQALVQFASLRGLLKEVNTGRSQDGMMVLVDDARRERLVGLFLEEMFCLATKVAEVRAQNLQELDIKTAILLEYLEPDDSCIVVRLTRSLCEDIEYLASR